MGPSPMVNATISIQRGCAGALNSGSYRRSLGCCSTMRDSSPTAAATGCAACCNQLRRCQSVLLGEARPAWLHPTGRTACFCVLFTAAQSIIISCCLLWHSCSKSTQTVI